MSEGSSKRRKITEYLPAPPPKERMVPVSFEIKYADYYAIRMLLDKKDMTWAELMTAAGRALVDEENFTPDKNEEEDDDSES